MIRDSFSNRFLSNLELSPAYKFLKTAHLGAILNDRTLRFGSLEQFRGMEVPGIGDKFEGWAENYHDPMSGLLTPDKVAILRKMGIYTTPGGTVSAKGNIVYSSYPNVPIFCFSVGSMKTVRPAFPDYDACFQIMDVAGLRDAILNTGTVAEFDGEPVSKHFRRIMALPVTYTSRTGNLSREAMMLGDPFKKGLEFRYQHEARFVLSPIAPFTHKFITVHVPELLQYLRQKDI